MASARGNPPDLPGFDYVKRIGEGGFADVFLYRQLLPARDVAIKVLIDNSADGAGVDLFEAEANVMAQLSGHPSIVPIYTAGVANDGRRYLVMEYCSGPNLSHRYKTERIPISEALDISIKIANAVETAHSAGILHRDIKPLNILTSAYGEPKLSDFGIAGTTGEGSTWSGGMSIPWSPPEAFWDETPPDVRSDVYSLAATTYTLLAGRSPFEVAGAANDNLTLTARIERQPLQRITRPDVPDELNQVLARGMAKSVEDRYPSAMEYIRAIQGIQTLLDSKPTVADVFDASGATTPRAIDDNLTRVRPIQVIVPEVIATRGTRIRPIVIGPKVDLDGLQMRAPESAAERTVARGGRRSVDPGSRPSVMHLDPGVESGAPLLESKGSLFRVAVAALLAFAVVIGGVLLLLSSSTDKGERNNDIAGDRGDAVAIGSDVPSEPKHVEVSLSGTEVTVSWTPVNRRPGDTYKLVDANNNVVARSDGRTATFAYSGEACIRVQAVRDGQTSESSCTAVVRP